MPIQASSLSKITQNIYLKLEDSLQPKAYKQSICPLDCAGDYSLSLQ